jgi:hypothetical protein
MQLGERYCNYREAESQLLLSFILLQPARNLPVPTCFEMQCRDHMNFQLFSFLNISVRHAISLVNPAQYFFVLQI